MQRSQKAVSTESFFPDVSEIDFDLDSEIEENEREEFTANEDPPTVVSPIVIQKNALEESSDELPPISVATVASKPQTHSSKSRSDSSKPNRVPIPLDVSTDDEEELVDLIHALPAKKIASLSPVQPFNGANFLGAFKRLMDKCNAVIAKVDVLMTSSFGTTNPKAS